jgi:hypothetical protein
VIGYGHATSVTIRQVVGTGVRSEAERGTRALEDCRKLLEGIKTNTGKANVAVWGQ